MSAAEFRLWWAYDKHHEPFGREWEQVWRIVAALIGRKNDGSPIRMEDVAPYLPPPMTPEELAAKVAEMRKRQQEG
jgi:hypothetical protein